MRRGWFECVRCHKPNPRRLHTYMGICILCRGKMRLSAFRAAEAAIRTRQEATRNAGPALAGQMVIGN